MQQEPNTRHHMDDDDGNDDDNDDGDVFGEAWKNKASKKTDNEQALKMMMLRTLTKDTKAAD